MPVTVRQILNLDVLREARLLAGATGLDRPVTSVTVGEVPDIADWLSGGEMVLSTLFAVKGDLERQREFCRRVMMAGAAALFVKTTRFVERMPPDVIALADKRGFPIIEVPQGLRWTRLMQAATELIINRQASQLEQSQEIQRSLLAVVIRGGGWQELVDEASRLLDKPVVVLDVSLEVVAASSNLAFNRDDLEHELSRPDTRSLFVSQRGEKLFHVEESGLPPFFSLPIVASQRRLGFICVFTDSSTLSYLENLVLEHAATIAALEMAQDRVRFETEVRLKGDFVDEVISGEASTGDSLLRRGAFLGCDLSRGATVMLLAVDEYDGIVERKDVDEGEISRRIEKFFERAKRHVVARQIPALVSLKGGHVVVFLCGRMGEDVAGLARLAAELQSIGHEAAGLTISVGVGGFAASPAQMSRGYKEAVVAIKVGRRLKGAGSILHFRDVGVYRFLLDLCERYPDEAQALYEETIGPIDRYDEENGTHLVETLQVFFRNDESLAKTASQLYAHRHTIRYRLEKIAEITGLSVFRTEHKERLSLGLKVRSLLRG